MKKSKNVMLAGVLSGLAEYFNISTTLVRLIFVILSLSNPFAGILLYIALSVIIPEY